MRKHFGPTGILFMGVLVALAALGVVYGLWSKNLLINGTVRTGDLNADWGEIVTNDLPGNLDPCLEGNPTGCPAPPKDVGVCTARVLGPGESEFPGQEAVVEISNAYPSYECTVTAEIKNTGTIPFNVIGGATDIAPPLELLPLAAGIPAQCVVGGAGADPDPRQVDPGQAGKVRCRIHVMQDAAQASGTIQPVYTFRVKVCVAQWNEAATYEQCIGSLQHEGPPN